MEGSGSQRIDEILQKLPEQDARVILGALRERQETEERLWESEKQSRSWLECSPVCTKIVDLDLNLQYMSNAGIQALRIDDITEFYGKPYPFDFYPESFRTEMIANLETAKATGEVITQEASVQDLDGNELWFQSTLVPVKDAEGCIEYLVVVSIETTERRRAEEALRQYECIVSNSSDMMALVDRNFTYLAVNDALLAACGKTRDQMVGKRVTDFVEAGHFNRAVKPAVERCMAGEKTSYSSWFEYASRGRIYIDVQYAPYTGPDQEIQGYVVVVRDMTENKLAEERLAAEKERLAVTLRSIGDGVITTDVQGRVLMLNKVAETLTGWRQQDARGKPLETVFAIIHEVTREPCENPVQKTLATGEITELANHTVLIARDGTERVIADSGAPIKNAESETVGVVLVFRDMTEKRKMQDVLQRTARLDSLSVLAGGIAHDFNNLLGGIFGYIELALSQSPDQSVVDDLDKALESMERARSLTQQLLTFAQGGSPVKEVGVLFPFAREAALFALSGANVSCHFDVPDNLWAVDFDKHQIGQVIDNLVINAQQAMAGGGTVEISGRNVTVEEGRFAALDPGPYVCLSVKDSGIGIPARMVDRIFDPFFTTKSKGHGLGLATCHSIITRHDGYIQVESKPGAGTTFHVYLPAVPGTVNAEVSVIPAACEGQGLVVVMDDEPMIRTLLFRLLDNIGFSAVCHENGEDTIAFVTKALAEQQEIRAVILDLTIPGGIGGKEAVCELRKLDQHLPIFVSSGYSEDPIMAKPQEYGFTASLAKPFRRAELMQVLSEQLGSSTD